MLLSEPDMVFQTFDVYAELCLRMDSIPPTRRDRATRATESRSASSMSWAPLLRAFLLRGGDITLRGGCAI